MERDLIEWKCLIKRGLKKALATRQTQLNNVTIGY